MNSFIDVLWYIVSVPSILNGTAFLNQIIFTDFTDVYPRFKHDLGAGEIYFKIHEFILSTLFQ